MTCFVIAGILYFIDYNIQRGNFTELEETLAVSNIEGVLDAACGDMLQNIS